MLIISILFIISIFSLYNICKIRKLYLSLQPQTRNNGAIAQLVEQRLKILVSPVRFLVAPPAKLQNASLSSVSEFFVLADSAELPIKLPIK